MEIEELKSMWQKYDLKLNNLESLNKKLLLETLAKRTQNNINWMRYRDLYVVFMVPIVLTAVLYPYFKFEYIDWKLITGCTLSLSIALNLANVYLKSFRTLKGLNLALDPVIESAQKINDYKNIFNRRQKFVWITYPALYIGVLLITWHGYVFDATTIFFMSGLFVFALALGINRFKEHKQRIEKLEKEIQELNDYKV